MAQHPTRQSSSVFFVCTLPDALSAAQIVQYQVDYASLTCNGGEKEPLFCIKCTTPAVACAS
jgi:hypothetical protein